MISNILVVIGHLHGCMGELAEKFVAMEMLQINRSFVHVEHGPNGIDVEIPRNIPNLPEEELYQLLEVIDKKLHNIVGPKLSRQIIDNIEYDIVTLMTTQDSGAD